MLALTAERDSDGNGGRLARWREPLPASAFHVRVSAYTQELVTFADRGMSGEWIPLDFYYILRKERASSVPGSLGLKQVARTRGGGEFEV